MIYFVDLILELNMHEHVFFGRHIQHSVILVFCCTGKDMIIVSNNSATDFIMGVSNTYTIIKKYCLSLVVVDIQKF